MKVLKLWKDFSKPVLLPFCLVAVILFHAAGCGAAVLQDDSEIHIALVWIVHIIYAFIIFLGILFWNVSRLVQFAASYFQQINEECKAL